MVTKSKTAGDVWVFTGPLRIVITAITMKETSEVARVQYYIPRVLYSRLLLLVHGYNTLLLLFFAPTRRYYYCYYRRNSSYIRWHRFITRRPCCLTTAALYRLFRSVRNTAHLFIRYRVWHCCCRCRCYYLLGWAVV